MNYSKPEVVLLGDAASLVQGSKVPAGDAGSLEAPIAADCELED